MLSLCFLSVPQHAANRMKLKLSKVFTGLRNKMMELNFFPLRDFGSDTDRITAKRLGQWTTSLYVILLAVIFLIIIMYTFIRPQIVTQTIARPSLTIYRGLTQDHSATLRCPCSSISSTYDRYVTIEPQFHQVSQSMYSLCFIPYEKLVR
jgi:hypothetical protein